MCSSTQLAPGACSRLPGGLTAGNAQHGDKWGHAGAPGSLAGCAAWGLRPCICPAGVALRALAPVRHQLHQLGTRWVDPFTAVHEAATVCTAVHVSRSRARTLLLLDMQPGLVTSNLHSVHPFDDASVCRSVGALGTSQHYTMITGGDDQALHVATFGVALSQSPAGDSNGETAQSEMGGIAALGRLELTASRTVPGAHSAAVKVSCMTALRTLSDS